ncbi:MAG: hypothetical protein HPY73_05735 [Methanomassiliicoccales archaeon]|nr:MAG: hypothetical protein HPY73_05735 [Methanomassiliicoccales archaeon]
MRAHREELERILRTVDGVPLIIDAPNLARKVCGIIGRPRPPPEEIFRAAMALKDQVRRPMYGLQAKELEGRSVKVMFWREHNERSGN